GYPVAQGSGRAAVEQAVVRVDAAVAQKRPGAAFVFDAPGVDVRVDHAFGFGIHAGEDVAAGAGDEGVAPEAEVAFASHAVGGGDEHAVGDGVAALDRDPRVQMAGFKGRRRVRAGLCGLHARLFVIPADGGRIQEDIRPL